MLNYLTGFVLLLPKAFANEVILVEKNQIIKVPSLEFGDFLRFVGIWLLITENSGTNRVEYFSETLIDIFGGC